MSKYREKIERNSWYDETKEENYCDYSDAIDAIDMIEYDLNQIQTTLEDIDNDSISSLHDGLDKAFEQIEELLRKVY